MFMGLPIYSCLLIPFQSFLQRRTCRSSPPRRRPHATQRLTSSPRCCDVGQALHQVFKTAIAWASAIFFIGFMDGFQQQALTHVRRRRMEPRLESRHQRRSAFTKVRFASKVSADSRACSIESVVSVLHGRVEVFQCNCCDLGDRGRLPEAPVVVHVLVRERGRGRPSFFRASERHHCCSDLSSV